MLRWLRAVISILEWTVEERLFTIELMGWNSEPFRADLRFRALLSRS